MISQLFRIILTAELAENAERLFYFVSFEFIDHIKKTDIDALEIVYFKIAQRAGYFRFAGLLAANRKNYTSAFSASSAVKKYNKDWINNDTKDF